MAISVISRRGTSVPGGPSLRPESCRSTIADEVVIAAEEESPEPGGTEPVMRMHTLAGRAGAGVEVGWRARCERIPFGRNKQGG